MNLDGLTMSVLTKELAQQLQGGQIQKLHQIDKTTLLFKVHGSHHNHDLVITVGNTPAIYISEPIQDLPKEPTSLCMFLRKHIEGSRISSINQINSDRILCLTIDKLELNGSLSSTKIYVELMGKYSNCIFVQEGKILESLIHVTPLMNRERSIAPKLAYDLPPNSNRVSLFDFTAIEILELLKNFHSDRVDTSIRAIFNGFGTPLLKELLYRVQIPGSKSYEELSEEDLKKLSQALYTLRQDLEKAKELLVYQINAKKIESPIELHYNHAEFVKSYDTISRAICQNVKSSGSINTSERELEKILVNAIKKEELRHSKIQKELEDTEKMDSYKQYGDLLMINAHLQVQYKKDITLDNILVTPSEPIVIPLKPELTILENGQHYYKLYSKLKNRMISGKYQLEQSINKLTYLQSILFNLSLCEDKQSLQEIRNECIQAGIIKKSKKPISYKLNKDNFIHITLDDVQIFIGKNNQQNDYLTHKFAKPNDLWFHTQAIQGSHLILRCPYEPNNDIILKAAAYAAYYSKARTSSKVPVDYVPVRFIKKPPASPPGFVIFTNQKTVYIDPLKPENLS